MATITSRSNAAVKAARKLARRAEREQTDAFLVEGPQAVREAIVHLQRLFVTPGASLDHPDLVSAAEAAGAEILEVTDSVIESLADTRTPQGLVGVATLPHHDLAAALDGATLAVALDQAQDPGNVGTVVRTADAAGADAVVLTPGSADPRNPKVVRASAGSVFHLPVVGDVPGAVLLEAARRHGLEVVATVPGQGPAHSELDLTGPTLVLFGNEARGLPDDLVAASDRVCQVPISGRAESLNLAATAAVLLFEAVRQRSMRRSWP